MKGTPSAAVISLSWPATSSCSCSDSTTQGPAIRNSGCSRPASKPQSFMRAGSRGDLLAARGLVLERGVDEGLEQGMSAPGRRLELGVELHADEPGVDALRKLDDLGQLVALGDRRDHQAGLGETVEVVLVGLVAVAVPLVDDV